MALYMISATAGFLFTWGIVSVWEWVRDKSKSGKIKTK